MKFLIIIPILLILLTGCGNKRPDNQIDINITDNQTSRIGTNITRTISVQPTKKEEEICSFVTKILIQEEARQTNLSITSGKLNGTIVNPGETFSFTNTVGKANPDEGYQKADIFDSEGNIVKGYGGGNCQVSSTLYNAVLATPKLTIVERHEHSRDVDYVPERKRCCCSLW